MSIRQQRIAEATLKLLYKAEVGVAVACLAIVLCAVVGDVVGRELLGRSIFGSQRVAVLANALIGLLGFSIVVGSGGHMRAGFFGKLGPIQFQGAINVFADVVSAAICIVLGTFSAIFVTQTYKFGETLLSLPVPLWPLQLSMPWMFFSSALRYGIFAAFPALRPLEEEITS